MSREASTTPMKACPRGRWIPRALPRRHGFTLLEVLVALALFTLVAIPLLRLELQCTAQVAQVSEARRALAAVNLVLAQALADPVGGQRTEKVEGLEVRVRTQPVDNLRGVERVAVAAYRGEEKVMEVFGYRARRL